MTARRARSSETATEMDQDIQFCFVKTAMHPLFDNLHGNSPKTVTVFVTGI